MLIRIIQDLADIPEYKRPFVGRVFEVMDTIYGKYMPNENYRHIIEVKGNRVAVHSSEYEVVRA